MQDGNALIDRLDGRRLLGSLSTTDYRINYLSSWQTVNVTYLEACTKFPWALGTLPGLGVSVPDFFPFAGVFVTDPEFEGWTILGIRYHGSGWYVDSVVRERAVDAADYEQEKVARMISKTMRESESLSKGMLVK